MSHGAELTYQRELGQIGRAYWGVEGAFNYMTLGLEGDLGELRPAVEHALADLVDEVLDREADELVEDGGRQVGHLFGGDVARRIGQGGV